MLTLLSGGDRQRYGWQSWRRKTPPISALDVAHQIEVLPLARKLCSERGIGVVLALHNINIMARLCDEILALHSDRAVHLQKS